MSDLVCSVPTIDYLENQIIEIRKVIRIVKKGIFKFSLKYGYRCDEICKLLDKYNIDYTKEEIGAINLVILSINSEMVKDI